MSQALIRPTLMTKLAAYAASHYPVLTISRENVPFTKPANGQTFLQAEIIPANTINPNVAADRRRFLGDFQVSIWVKEGSGAGVAELIAEEISQLFKVYPKELLPVSIEAPAKIKLPLTDNSGWYITPVIISYRLEAED